MALRSSLRASFTSKGSHQKHVELFSGAGRKAGRQVRLQCSAGLLTAPTRTTYGNARFPTPSIPALGQPMLRSLSYDEVDLETPLAYELYQGPLARWTHTDAGHSPPTAVMVHGILGNRKNMSSFAKMLVEGFPSWQVLLVDLRCHGESARLPSRPTGPHGVAEAAGDVLGLLRRLRLFPRVLVGHSFGGKVVMSMVQQFNARLPRPVQVWVLDSLPGEVRCGGGLEGRDHPGQLIQLLRSLRLPLASRGEVIDTVVRAGFSPHVARWVVTNLRPLEGDGYPRGGSPGLGWGFDLDGIAELYSSYERTQLWGLLQQPPQGLTLDFVKAERSSFRWGGPDEAAIRAAGHGVHLLPDAGHWVHADNPLGLYELLAPSFGAESDLKQRRSAALHP